MPDDNLLPADLASAIVDQIADGVFVVDRNLKVIFFNQAAERMTGFSKEEAVGQFCYEIFRTPVCLEDCPLKKALTTKEKTIDWEVEILDRDNRRMPVSVSTSAIVGKKGDLMGGVETFRDLSAVFELTKEITEKYTFHDIISQSPQMLRIFEILPDVAASDATVLLLGESGTGKELVATAIHNLSSRAAEPMVKINCGAIPETLLESELFGYQKGAFTGATANKPGRFQQANRGTIFLDEIADLPLSTQVKLLRVIQERVVEPLGGTKSVPVDVRIIAATNRDLEVMVRKGDFRHDLYYRLRVVPLTLPPLRERREDIPLLVDRFMDRFNLLQHRSIRRLSPKAMKTLMEYDYPGNIRELENIIQHAFIVSRGNEIRGAHLPSWVAAAVSVTISPSLRDTERDLLVETLKRFGGNKTAAAQALGIHRVTLWRKLKRYGLLP